jgi:ketosteroid isomerase-like protein
MKNIFMVIPLVFLLCLTFGCQQQVEEVAEEPAVDVEADIEATESLINECSRAWNEEDYEGFMAIIDEEAIFLPPNAPSFGSMETIRSIGKTEFGSFDFDVTITTEKIHVSGDLAFSRDLWNGPMNPKDGGEPIVFENKNLVLYKRQVDGSWKTWRAMYSSNTPPTAD